MISSFLTGFAAEGPAVHVAPGVLYEFNGWVITNSILYGWICMAVIAVVLITIARLVTIRPRGGLIQFIEAGVDFISGLVIKTFDDKSKGVKYVPFFVTLFFFLLLNNWLGLLPGVGEAFNSGGTPLFRPFTADLNGTLAAGIITMTYVYVSSIREAGGFAKYLGHFFVGSPLNPLYLIIGMLEILTDLTRVFSLSLRLFLNVTIGEIVIAVFAYLGQIAAPLLAAPFVLVELFVGALQAYIFTVLSLNYLAIAANHGHGSEHEESGASESLTGTVEAGTMASNSGRSLA